jgi:phosphate transport system substrate-binding protein
MAFRPSLVKLLVGIVGGAGALAASVALASTQLTGAGSSFVYPFFSKAFYQYSQEHSNVTVNYQSIGSGAGIQQFIAKTVDFGASDVPMNADEIQRAGGTVLQAPVTLGGAAICYNIPGVGSGLRLTRQMLVDIFLFKIVNWNDHVIKSINPSITLPDLPIVVVHRSDGSGTSYIFTDFLSNVSPDWKAKVGTGKSVQWPAGVGAKGNEGLAGEVRETTGGIGYVELAYVLENQMTYAMIQNKAGNYVYPSIETVAAAAATKPSVSSTDFSIVDATGDNSYPISGYTWVMLHQAPDDPGRAKLVQTVLEWVVTKGQDLAKSVNYVPLPDSVQQQALKVIAQMKT